MASNLEIRVLFAAIDKFVRPAAAITDASRKASKALKETRDAQKGLENQSKLIESFRSANKQIGITGHDLEKARELVKRLALEMNATAVPTAKMQSALAKATEDARHLAAQANRLAEKKQRLRKELSEVGIDTKKLSEQQRDLKSKMEAASAAVKQQEEALGALNKRKQQQHAIEDKLNKLRKTAATMAKTGVGMLAAGAAVGVPVAKAGKDFADFETAMLGVARQMEGARDANGKVTQTYWEMADAIKAMSERLPGSANDIAKIVEAGARMGIQGKQNLLTYAETTAIMASAFDLPVDQVGEDIGNISQLYKVPIKDIKALGDTINWLDDNALANGGDIIDVMKRIAGTADMAHMSFKQAAALGSTFLSLGAAPEVAASASNAMIRELSIANMQSKRFKEGMAMLGLNGKDVQQGMSNDATGTIIKVLEKIKSLAGDKQLEAATRLFGKEFGDDASKLAANLEEYRRQLALVNAESAKGSMDRENNSRADTLNQRIEDSRDAFTNLSSDLGKLLKPAIADALETTLGMIQAVRDWVAKNPELAGTIMHVVKWVGLAALGFGGLLVAISAIATPLAIIRYAFSGFGIGAKAISLLTGAFGLLKGAFFAIGRLLMANPLFAAIAIIAAAAYVIYENWEPIKKFFSDIWDGVSKTTKLAWGELKDWFGGLADSFMSIGSDIVNGMIRGIESQYGALKEAVTGMGGASVDWLKEKLGIHSPSRVFEQLGAYTMQGFEQGLLGNTGGALSAMGEAAKKIAAVGAGIAISAAPVAATAGQSKGGDTYQITIQRSVGDSDADLVKKLEGMLERIQMKKQASARASLRDTE